MPEHLADFHPAEWGDHGPGTVGAGLGPTADRCAARWRWHRARGEWQLAHGVPRRERDARERYALLMVEWAREYGHLSA